MPTAYVKTKTCADRGSHKPPAVIPKTDWQAGFSKGNDNLRPLLDGAPCPLAFAARVGPNGWVMSFVDAPDRNQGPAAWAIPTNDAGKAQTVTLRGNVVLVRCDR